MDLICIAGVVLDRADDFAQVIVQGDRVWLAIVPCLDCCQRLSVFLNQLSELVENVCSSIGVNVSPFRVLECFPGCCDRDVDVFWPGCINRNDLTLIAVIWSAGSCQSFRRGLVTCRYIPRVYRSNGLAGFGRDEFVVDEQASWLLVLAAIRRCEFHEEVGHIFGRTIVPSEYEVVQSKICQGRWPRGECYKSAR